MTTINLQLQFRLKGESEWRNFPGLPTVDNDEHLFFEFFMHNHSSSDYIASEEDIYMWLNDEYTTEEFKAKGHDIPTKWQAEDERKRLRQIIINETMEDFFADLVAGKIEFSIEERERKLESALRRLLDVALLEITCFEESHTFEVCEAALDFSAASTSPKEQFVFLYAVNRHDRNISDEEIIKSWEQSEDEDLDTERYTPDEFACMVNDEDFCDSRYWIRFIEM